MSSLGKRCAYELERSGLAYRVLTLGRLGFRGANNVLEQTGRAPFACHCERGRGSETAVREGCQISELTR